MRKKREMTEMDKIHYSKMIAKVGLFNTAFCVSAFSGIISMVIAPAFMTILLMVASVVFAYGLISGGNTIRRWNVYFGIKTVDDLIKEGMPV